MLNCGNENRNKLKHQNSFVAKFRERLEFNPEGVYWRDTKCSPKREIFHHKNSEKNSIRRKTSFLRIEESIWNKKSSGNKKLKVRQKAHIFESIS